MRKLFSLMLVLLFAISLVSCGDDDSQDTAEELKYDIHTELQRN